MVMGMASGTTKTKEFSILNVYGQDYEAMETGNDAFYQDLNLLPVIDKMTALWGKSVRKLFFFLP